MVKTNVVAAVIADSAGKTKLDTQRVVVVHLLTSSAMATMKKTVMGIATRDDYE